MNRAAFEHAVRAAGAVLGRDELIVIGSQALHGSIDGDLPIEAERSVTSLISRPRSNAPFGGGSKRRPDQGVAKRKL